MRVIVVGAGVLGLVTAIRCARVGHRVTVVDRGRIPNPAATSSDQHRVVRALHPGDAGTTRLVADAHRLWAGLADLLDTPFFRRVGVLTVLPADDLAAACSLAASAGVRVEPAVAPVLGPPLRFPAGSVGLCEPDGGVLLADRMLAAAARWLGSHPDVTLCPGRAVRDVDAVSGRVELADGSVLRGDLVLIAAGPWSRELVDLPVVLHRQTMVYLRPPPELAARWSAMPAVGGIGVDGRAWLVPPGAGTLLKVSSSTLCREVDALDAADDAGRASGWDLGALLHDADRYVRVGVKDCHYLADAVSGGPVYVQLGPVVFARPACGGSGFTAAPSIADRFAAAAAAGWAA